MKTILSSILLFFILFFFVFCMALQSDAALNQDQVDRNNPENFVSMEFDNAPLSDVMFLVAEITEKTFVLTAVDKKISWVQSNIYKKDLLDEFLNVVTSSGLIYHESNNAYLITGDSSPLSNVKKSVGFYKLKHIKSEALKETSEILYKNRLAINPVEDSSVVLMSGDPRDVEQFISLIEAADTRKETDITVYRLQNISVKTARVALIEIGIFEDNSFYPDYWNRSIIIRGDEYQQSVAELMLSAIDVPYEGIVDDMQFVTSITPEAAIEVIQGVVDGVTVRKVADDRILLSGQSDLVEKGVVLLNKIDGAGLQVKIEAVIAYLTDKEYEKLGFKFNGVTDTGRYFTLTDTLTGTSIGLLSEFEELFNWSVNAEDSISHGSVISSPILTVANGKSARLHVGQNVPYLSEANVDKNDGTTTGTSIEREDVGVTFNVTPIISPDGQFVNVKLDQVISSIAPDSEIEQRFQDIVLDKQELSSQVKIADGQTIFLGGLSVDEEGSYTEKIPLLGDIPIVGQYLFSYNSDTTEKRNLVVSLRVKVIGS